MACPGQGRNGPDADGGPPKKSRRRSCSRRSRRIHLPGGKSRSPCRPGADRARLLLIGANRRVFRARRDTPKQTSRSGRPPR
jgi:hypothetical protein